MKRKTSLVFNDTNMCILLIVHALGEMKAQQTELFMKSFLRQ